MYYFVLEIDKVRKNKPLLSLATFYSKPGMGRRPIDYGAHFNILLKNVCRCSFSIRDVFMGSVSTWTVIFLNYSATYKKMALKNQNLKT